MLFLLFVALAVLVGCLFTVVGKVLITVWQAELANLEWVRRERQYLAARLSGHRGILPLIGLGAALMLIWWPFPVEPAMALGVEGLRSLALSVLGLVTTVGVLRYISRRLAEQRAHDRLKAQREFDAHQQLIWEILQEQLRRSEEQTTWQEHEQQARRARQRQWQREQQERVRPASSPVVPRWAQVLGLTAAASEREIQQAYRELAKKRHPDRGGSDALMQQLNEARDQAVTALKNKK